MVKTESHRKCKGAKNPEDCEEMRLEILAILKQIDNAIHRRKDKTRQSIPEIEDLGLTKSIADMNVILQKRTPEILYFLHRASHENKPLRFTELHHEIGDIGTSTLINRLRDLEQMGVVNRKAYREIPPRVEYTLTKRGRELITILILLIMWSNCGQT